MYKSLTIELKKAFREFDYVDFGNQAQQDLFLTLLLRIQEESLSKVDLNNYHLQ